jgi:DNA-binding NtrC family response regulator
LGLQILIDRQRQREAETQEFALKQEQLEAAGRLAAEIAHQLKNPLGIINNAAYTLQKTVREGKTITQQISIIREEVARSDRIITDLMGYARLVEGKVERVTISEILEQSLAIALPPGAGFSIQVHLDVPPALPVLLGQRGHFLEIFTNLLVNAREAMDEKGQIWIIARPAPDYAVQVSVRDSGPGIPVEVMGRIWESYFTTKDRGTGLGLTIVKHTSEMYGGARSRGIGDWQGDDLYGHASGTHLDENPMKLPPLLVVDDEKNMRLSLQTVLESESYAVRLADSAEAGLKLIQQENFFMVITDARLGGMSGYEFLKTVAEKRPELPVIMITAYATPKLAVEAIKSGATDYLAKPFEPDELLHAVGRCAERHRLLTENAALKARAGNGIRIENIVGESPKMRELRQLIQTVAPTDATVLILGESGTGKELIAGAIHFHSHRATAPYIRLNCAAIPETLLESELFGYERGAFTGAHRTKRGYVEEADGGTIFLDEIGDMSRSLQAKLLRFLEDGSFTRVGGTQELRVQVRLIAATNRNIVEAIKKGEFREDLFHRLNVMQFRPPPLRERGSDIPLLARNFLKGFAAKLGRSVKDISPLAMQALQAHSWPGNVRELRNVIERAVILEPTEWIQPASLPDFEVESRLRDGPVERSGAARGGSLPEALLRFEREMILDALESCGGSLSKAASALDLSRHSLRYRMGRLGLGVDGGVDRGLGPGGRVDHFFENAE